MSTAELSAPAKQQQNEILTGLSLMEIAARIKGVYGSGRFRINWRSWEDEEEVKKTAATFRHYSVGGCCGAYIIDKNWKIPTMTDGFPEGVHSILTGFDESKYPKEGVPRFGMWGNYPQPLPLSYLKSVYSALWPKVFTVRDSSYLLFVEGHTHEEAIEYIYSENFRKDYKIHGFTLEDKDVGLMSAIWVDK
jgi:hypothetical protein